jgi:DNA-binding GntR family transcriptional regulator
VVHRVHTRIADAMLSGDVAAAERRMRRHLETVLRYLTDAENGAAARRRVKPRPVPSAAS